MGRSSFSIDGVVVTLATQNAAGAAAPNAFSLLKRRKVVTPDLFVVSEGMC